MPVTAKLSKHFYEVLGEDVANELVDWFNAVDLTYRAELRELNELNYARFDAKLEQRLAELRADLRQEMAEFKFEVRGEIAALRSDLSRGLAELRTELRAEIHDGRVSMLRWMFGFWATSTLTIAGLVLALFSRIA